MEKVIELVELYEQLNESNRFALLVYARMKVTLQLAAQCRPDVEKIIVDKRVHWVK